MMRRGRLVIFFALWLLGWVAVGYWVVVPPQFETAGVRDVNWELAELPQGNAVKSYSALHKRNLWGESPAAEKPSRQSGKASKASSWVLRGIVRTESGGLAIIENNGEVLRLSPGQTLPDGSSLVTIFGSGINVGDENGQREVLLYDH